MMMTKIEMDKKMKKWFKLTFKRTSTDDPGYYEDWVRRFKNGPREVWGYADNNSRAKLKIVFPSHFKGVKINTNLWNAKYLDDQKYDRG